MAEIMGVDVSYYQGPMDWAKCAEAGARYAFIRAGSISSLSGICYYDYQFKRNAVEAPKHLPVGFYWFFRPNFDPLFQANYFCDLIREKNYKLPMVIDLEQTGGLSAAAITDAALQFIMRVYERTGVWCLTYGRSLWLNRYTVQSSIWDYVELFVARYTDRAAPWGNPEDVVDMKPYYFDDWRFWQKDTTSKRAVEFGGAGPPQYEDDIDISVFNGSELDWKNYSQMEEPMPGLVMVNRNKNSILRAVPNGEILTTANFGQLMGVSEAVTDEAGNLWYRVAAKDFPELWIVADHVDIVNE